MKKVCHITSAHPQRDIRILIKECVSLTKEYDVHLVVLNGTDEVFEGVKISSAHTTLKGRLDRFTKGVKAVYQKALEVDADLYHLHDPELLQIASKLKRKGKKVIFDAHENLPMQIKGKYWINKYLRNTVSNLMALYERRVVRKIDAVITATPSITAHFVPSAKKVETINNFPLMNELASSTIWEEKLNEATYMGGITEIRGCTEMIEAFDGLDNIRLNLAGSYSPENYRASLMNLKGWKAVNEFGLVGRKEVAELLNRSKVGLVLFKPVPNHVDAQPNKMFEYMSAGIPMITCNFPLWREIVEGNNCGICVEPENPEAIHNALVEIFADDEQARIMGENGRKAVVEKYNWEAEEKKLLAFYKSLF